MEFSLNGRTGQASLQGDPGRQRLWLEGVSHAVFIGQDEKGRYAVTYKGFEFSVERPDMAGPDNVSFAETMGMNIDPGNIVSPMPGRVLKINVSAGDVVKKGQVLMVVEAMKMENNILSPADGVVDKLLVKEGDMVDGSARLVHLEHP
ncbi:MAG: biotin/lipoyl-binding protein [Bacteroidales bacterium]|nr:biotin/lipoyl-binding protein [Bacteroidales bacterium]